MVSRGFGRQRRSRRPAAAVGALIVLVLLAGVAAMFPIRRAVPGKGDDGGKPAKELAAFQTFIGVSWDSSVTIIDSVVVRAAGENFKKGLHRRLPPAGNDEFGAREFYYRSEYLKLDDRQLPLPQSVEERGRLHFTLGLLDRPLTSGEHRYEWKYVVQNLVGAKDSEQGFSWDVTEPWNQPVRAVDVLLRLPPTLPREVVVVKGSLLRRSESGFAAEKMVPCAPWRDPGRPNEKLLRCQLPEVPPGRKFRVTVSWPRAALRPFS